LILRSRELHRSQAEKVCLACEREKRVVQGVCAVVSDVVLSFSWFARDVGAHFKAVRNSYGQSVNRAWQKAHLTSGKGRKNDKPDC
jgi:hypothetical protein